MTTPELEVLSALVDGEAVSTEELERALRHPEATGLLVDFVRLRGEIETSAQPARRLRAASSPTVAPWGWLTAAALAVVLVGLVLSRGAAVPETTEPPDPDRVIRLERGTNWIG